MPATADHTQVLDQLQREVNLILEQTGRLFAAADTANRGTYPEAALARASRLKQLLPVSNNRFHDALDTLDEELQFAKAVMRRDLALCRRREGTQAQVKTPDARSLAVEEAEFVPAKSSSSVEELKAAEPVPQPSKSLEIQVLDDAKSSPTSTKRSSPQPEDIAHKESPPKKVAAEKTTSEEVEAGAKDDEAAESKLQLNTNPPELEDSSKQKSDDERGPDTGTFSNNADLDSLFNDPTSAGGLGGDSGEGTDFGTDPNTGNDFDFATFNASLGDSQEDNNNDNDNISALLPGLSDYANDSNVEPDFSALFATDPSATGNDAIVLGDGQVDDGEQRDTTFDDFMDLTFDMSGDGNEGGGANQEFNFDFS